MKKKKSFIAARNELTGNGTTLELQFLDYFYDEWDWDTWQEVKLLDNVIKQVRELKPSKIVVLINSGGGLCDLGLAIYAYLKNLGGIERETHVLALSASIATVVQQVASPGKRLMAKSASMMIHEASGGGYGTAKDLRAAADQVDHYTGKITEILAEHSGQTAETITGFFAEGDYWMTATEAIALGFADALIEDVPGFSFMNSVEDYSEDLFPHLPAFLQRIKPANGPANEAPGDPEDHSGDETILSNIFSIITNKDMKFKDKVAAFKNAMQGKKINPGAEDLAAEVANQMADPLGDMLQGVQDEVEAAITAQQTTITDAINAALPAQISTAITTATAALQSTVDAQAVTISNLITELADLTGKELKTGDDDGLVNGVKPIGYGVKAKA